MEKETKRNDELELESQSEEFKMLSEEEQLEILQKYDPESNTRNVTGVFKKIVFLRFTCIFHISIVYGDWNPFHGVHSTFNSLRICIIS